MTYVHRRLRARQPDKYLIRVPGLTREMADKIREQFTADMLRAPVIVVPTEVEVYRR